MADLGALAVGHAATRCDCGKATNERHFPRSLDVATTRKPHAKFENQTTPVRFKNAPALPRANVSLRKRTMHVRVGFAVGSHRPEGCTLRDDKKCLLSSSSADGRRTDTQTDRQLEKGRV